ncbi:DUF1778 domain-containing protein [Adlercreutzia sp. ZJ138]|uniref:type II toxin-antitoxin system TacA family antitoxin n=1 Tax=Adlercreutzia sp. ZJ138 TaxID=2709405 RepID=UPI0013EA1668|nr:DUF1778 domain-containing protein [Adlercreutzia sp. ZJ138]
MATVTKEKRCRMDLRLTQPQRSSYETAAALKGQTLSQWSTSKLDEAARRDIEEANVTRLAAKAFDSFCKMLDEPMPKATRDLLARDEIWS